MLHFSVSFIVRTINSSRDENTRTRLDVYRLTTETNTFLKVLRQGAGDVLWAWRQMFDDLKPQQSKSDCPHQLRDVNSCTS